MAGAPSPPPSGSEYRVYQARITRAGEVYSNPAKKTMLAGTPGAGLPSSVIIRGYPPDTPSGSYRDEDTATVEVSMVESSKLVELEKQP